MLALSIACSLPLLAASSTHALQATPTTPKTSEVPARIAALVRQLEVLDGPVAYTVQVHRRRLWLHGEGESRALLRETLRSWADRVAAGDPPTYREGLELFHTPRPASDHDEVAGGATGRLVRHEYARRDDLVHHVLHGADGWTWGTLLHGDVALRYDSARGGVRAMDYDHERGAAMSTETGEPYGLGLLDPTELLGVLRTEARYRGYLEGGPWSPVDGASVDTLVTGTADSPEWRFALCFDDEGALPAAAVDQFAATDESRIESIALSLYQRPGAPDAEGIGLLETLYFDATLRGDETDAVWLEHQVVHARRVPAADAAAWRLAVPVTSELFLRDERADADRRRLGTSLEAWPDELVEWIRFER